MPGSLVGVQTIDVEKIDRAIREMVHRLIEGHSQKAGKTTVTCFTIPLEARKNLFPVAIGMFVSMPGIDCVTFGVEGVLLYCLAKSKVGIPGMSPEFY